jgi:hypothetical protein
MGKWVSSSRIKVGLHSLFRGCSSWGHDDNGTFQTPVWFGAGAEHLGFKVEAVEDTGDAIRVLQR